MAIDVTADTQIKDTDAIVDNQAESGVIATLVYHPEFILHSEHLKAGYFYDKDNSCIYWAIQELFKAGIDTIDAFNISNMINSNAAVKKTAEQYNLPSMQEYIDLCSAVARDTLEEYLMLVDKVIELSFKRDLNKLLLEFQRNCHSKTPLQSLSQRVYGGLDKLTEKYIVTSSIKLIGEVADDLWEEICNRRNDSGYSGIPSKFPAINEYFTYEPTEMILIKARMKRGKSALLMNEAIHKLTLGIPTVYFDTEMEDRLFFERMLGNITGIETKRIKNGNYSDEEAEKIEKARKWIKKQPFVHMNGSNLTNEKIYSTCKILKNKMNLQFVIFDYIKSNALDPSVQYNELGEKCDFLKNNIATDLKLPVLAAAQLNRQGEVADSDKLERYCSTSCLWREKKSEEYSKDGDECGNYLLHVGVNRLGEKMSDDDYIDMRFDGSRMRIEQAKQHENEKLF